LAGLPTRAYAALVAADKGVSLHYLSSETEARRRHREGMLWLAMHQCAAEAKQIKRHITPALTLDFAPFGNKAQLEEQVVHAVFRAVCTGEPVYTRPDFDAWLAQRRPQLLTEAARLVRQLAEAYALWRQVQKELSMPRTAVFEPAIADIRAQLQALQPAVFAVTVAPARWQEYPRYLKAVQVRLQRLPNNLTRDSQAHRTSSAAGGRWNRNGRSGPRAACRRSRWTSTAGCWRNTGFPCSRNP